MNRPLKTLFWCLAIVIILVTFLLCSCTSSKKVNKAEEKIVVKTEYIVDSSAKEKIDSVKKHYEERIKSLDNSVEFFNPNESLVDYPCDTIKEFIPRIIYRPDGSFEAVGIKKANLKLFDYQKKYDSLSVEYNLEISKRLVLEQELKAKDKEVVKEKKPSGWWILILIVISIATWEILKRKIRWK